MIMGHKFDVEDFKQPHCMDVLVIYYFATSYLV